MVDLKEGDIWSDGRPMDPNLEPMPPPYHPPPPVLAGTEVRWAPGLHLISTQFQGERCKAPLEEKAGEVLCSRGAGLRAS